MANDPYSPCPCGSGKKLKFCCGDILTDLQKGLRLRDNQPEAAIRLFRDLLKKHPDKDVVARELISTLYDNDGKAEARQVAAEFLKAHPDNAVVLITLSEILLKEDGFEASRRVIHRAFQLGAKANAAAIAYLAALVASQMMRNGCYMSAREHLALSVRMSSGQRQQSMLMSLVGFESEHALPQMFRCAHPLIPVNCSEDAAQQDLRARKLSVLGCWEPASILYNRLADAYPTEGSVWYNLGLCQAWDGKIREAAGSLHHAATLLTDFDQAVASEALAQQIDQQLSEERYSTLSVNLEIQSISELLTRLEADSTILRNDTHDHSECHHHDGTQHVAELVMLNGEPKSEGVTSFAQLPEAIADIDVFDVVDEDEAGAEGIQKPMITVTTVEHLIDTVIVRLRDLVGDLIVTRADQENRRIEEYERLQAKPFDRRFFRPPGLKQKDYGTLMREFEPQAVEAWLQLPHPALGGKSPAEASSDPALKLKLAAALILMQGVASKYDIRVNLSGLRSRLGLPAPTPVELPASASAASLPMTAYERLQFANLTDAQLNELVNRSSVLGLTDVVSHALDELIRRDENKTHACGHRIYLMRSAIARVEGNYEQAFACVERARGAVQSGPEAFRTQLEIDVRELSYRLDDPEDPGLKTLLNKFRDKYLHKIPDIEEVITEQLESAGCGHLISELTGGLVMSDSMSGSSLWTPGADAAAAPAGKLWVPGQS